MASAGRPWVSVQIRQPSKVGLGGRYKIAVEKTTYLENKTHIYGRNYGNGDFKPKMTKKAPLLSNEERLKRDNRGKGRERGS